MRNLSLVQKLMRASPRELAYAAEASAALVAVSIAIRLAPFRKIVERVPSPDRTTGKGVSDESAAAIGLAVERASRHIPWRTVCFHEALVAHWMLRRRSAPSTLHYGLSNSDEFKAHTWVSLGDLIIVGGRAMGEFHCVATFPQGSAQG